LATFLARFGTCEVKEGASLEGVAIMELPAFEAAKAWYESAAYREANQRRFKGGDYDIVLVEGVSASAAL
jgi:uncharacterized protein (DUF1330 family)